MHVKYASRHALYPVPNVFVPVAVAVVVARALRAGVIVVATRDVATRAVLVDAVRATVFGDAVRATVFGDAVRADVSVALRDVMTLVLPRVVVVRDCALTVPPPRDVPDCD